MIILPTILTIPAIIGLVAGVLAGWNDSRKGYALPVILVSCGVLALAFNLPALSG